MRPTANPCGEKNAESSLPMNLPIVGKTIPNISSQEGEATITLSQRDAEYMNKRSSQQSKSTSISVQSKPTTGVSDFVSAASPVIDFQHVPSVVGGTTLGTKTDLHNESKFDDNDEKSHSLLQNQVLRSF